MTGVIITIAALTIIYISSFWIAMKNINRRGRDPFIRRKIINRFLFLGYTLLAVIIILIVTKLLTVA